MIEKLNDGPIPGLDRDLSHREYGAFMRILGSKMESLDRDPSDFLEDPAILAEVVAEMRLAWVGEDAIAKLIEKTEPEVPNG